MRKGVAALVAVVSILAAWLSLRILGSPGGPPQRPNVVLVLIDTLRADKLGVYGSGVESSPELDALARRGVRFERVLAPTSWTRGSVGALLTSLPPRSLGIYDERRDALDDRFTTLAEVLWAAGYWTLGATANPNLNRSFRFDQGFDVYLDSNVLWRWMEDEPGKTKETRAPVPAGAALYAELLEALGKEPRRPFFLQVTVMEVHEHEALAGRPGSERWAELFPEEAERDYLRAVRQASYDAGAFVRAIEELAGGPTLFVITSDHGEGLGDHPHVGGSRKHGLLLYESNLRVPLILYSSGDDLPAGRVVRRTVQLLDLTPTILDYLGLSGPAEMEGRSLLPLLRDPDAAVDLPRTFMSETNFRHQHKLAVYDDGWKYIENPDGHKGTPPVGLHPAGVTEDGTQTDVAEQHGEVVDRLARELRAWEAAHPPTPRTSTKAPLSLDEAAQLRAIGYLE